jgi:superfamily II DNA/RNA helicase
MKSAIIEEFRSDRASILLGTEAAAEGINLHFATSSLTMTFHGTPSVLNSA